MDLGFRQRRFCAALSTIVLLMMIASCGGSGGSGGDADPPPSIQSPRAWGTAERIDTNAGDAEYPQIAMDSAGKAIVVWQQDDNIWASHFDGMSWGTAALIESESDPADRPQIAMDGAGKAIVVWRQRYLYFNIWARHFDGAAWGTAALIETEPHDANFPQITMDSAGNAIAVWAHYDGISHSKVRANYFDVTDTNWGTSNQIETNPLSSAFPQAAMDGAGNAIVVWHDHGLNQGTVWAKALFDGIWSDNENLTGETVIAASPQIATNAADDGIVVWTQWDGSRNSIWAITTTTGAVEIQSTYGSGSFPQIAMDDAGNAIAVWYQDNVADTRTSIWASHFDGMTWGTAALIESEPSLADQPQIAMDGAGNAIAVWRQDDGLHFRIYTNHFDGTNWGTVQSIGADISGDAANPQIAFDGAGNAIAVWQQWDGTRHSIWANRFE
jgi:hypothetical protein